MKPLNRIIRSLGAGALAVLALVGCDAQRIRELEEDISTEADVRERFGDEFFKTQGGLMEAFASVSELSEEIAAELRIERDEALQVVGGAGVVAQLQCAFGGNFQQRNDIHR